MTIRNKLLFSFFGIIFLTIIIAGMGLYSMRKISNNIYNVSENLFPASTEAKELAVAIWMIDANFKSLIFAKDALEANEANQNITAAIKSMDEISAFLKEKFLDREEITARIEQLEKATQKLFILKENIYENAIVGLTLMDENVRMREKSLTVVDDTISSIAEQADNAEFSMLLMKEESEKGLAKAVESTKFMAESYNILSQNDFPTIKRLLSVKASFHETHVFMVRLLNIKEAELLPVIEDKIHAGINALEGHLSKLKASKGIQEGSANELWDIISNYRNLILGKEGLKEIVDKNLRNPSDSFKTKLSKLELSLAEKADGVISLIDSLIDDFEFNMMVRTEKANQSIKEGLEKTAVINDSFYTIINETMPLTRHLLLLKSDISMAVSIAERIMSSDKIELLVPLADSFLMQITSAKENINKLKKLLDDKDTNELTEYVHRMGGFIAGEGGILSSRRLLLGNIKQSEEIIDEVGSYIHQISTMVNDTVGEVSNEAVIASDVTRRVVANSTGSIGISSIFAVVVGMTITLLLSTVLVKNLRLVTNWIKTLSDDVSRRQGDLTSRLKMKSHDELGVLGGSFDRFLDNFAEMTKVIRGASNKVDVNAKSIADSSQQINTSLEGVSTSIQQITKGANLQVDKVDETSRIIFQVTNSLRQIAQNANQVANSVVHSTKLAGKGKESNIELAKKMSSLVAVVENSATAVNELDQRSEQIGNIINTINTFADQTNLLALNAAIEAARAGDAGRGFAVVAEEVRKLAEGSSKSADEIVRLIKAVQEEIDNVMKLIAKGKQESNEGQEIVQKLNSLQDDIVEASAAAEAMTKEISQLIPEQLKGAEQATAAITEVSSVAQENASSTEEVSSTIEEISASIEQMVSGSDALVNVVAELQNLVGQFKV